MPSFRRFARLSFALGSCTLAFLSPACLPPGDVSNTQSGEHWDPPPDPTRSDDSFGNTTSDASSTSLTSTASTTTFEETTSDSTATTSSDPVDPAACVEQESLIANGQTTAPNLGFSANAIVDPWRFPITTPFYWAKLSDDPVRAIFEPNQSATNLSVQLVGDILRVREIVATGEAGMPGPATCRARLEVDAQARLRSEDSGLDEIVPVHVVAHATGLVHLSLSQPWHDIKGNLHVSEIIAPSLAASPTLGDLQGHLILSAGRVFGHFGAELKSSAGSPATPQAFPFTIGEASLDDPFCGASNRASLPLETAIGSISGTDVINRLRTLEPLQIALPNGTTRVGRLAVPTLPEAMCVELGDGKSRAGGDAYLAADLKLFADDGVTQLLILPQVEIIAQSVPIAAAFSLFMNYDAFSHENEDAPTFLARHGLNDVVLQPHTAYSLSARAFIDHSGKVGGFLQINGIERDPGCTPQSPGCNPEIATQLWRANLITN